MDCNNIRGGFSFCGVDIGDLKLSYAPEKEDTYVFRPAEVNVHEETFDGHNGGYFYGVSRQPKEFTLRCYFEEASIDRGIMERIFSLFKLGRSGKLIFSRKPWCYYYATVTGSPALELSNFENGLITVTMKSYYPYARSDSLYTLQDYPKHEMALETTALFDKENMAPVSSFTNLTVSVPDKQSIYLCNPGTERAPLSIAIAGNAGLGVVIRNKTTNQECRIVVMDKAHTTNVNKAVYIDGISGKTSLISSEDTNPGFVYHDYGFIELEPAFPAERNVYVGQCTTGVITLYNTLYSDVTGHYIYMGDGWYKILEQIDSQTLRVDGNPSLYEQRTMIVKMNELEIIPDSSMDLSMLEFYFKPTFA